MDRKTLPVSVEWKAGSASSGEVEGYASVFGNVDLEGDVVMPGAFTKSVQEFPTRAQPLPLIADHQLTTAGVVGSVTALKQDSKGLWFKAKFSSKATAQDLRTDVIEGHIRGTSFTYDVIRAGPGMINGKAIRQLHELRLWEITISPFPVNEMAGLVSAKATSAPWDGSPARFTDAEYARSCVLDRGPGAGTAKQRYSLPIREPSGALNSNAVHAAAARFGQVDAPSEVKTRAARALIRAYGELNEDPPESLRRAAGQGAASVSDEWVASMEHALAIPIDSARKAAISALVAEQVADHEQELVADPEDAGATTDDAANGDGTSAPNDAYAVAFMNSGPSDGTPDGTPPLALPEPLAVLEQRRSQEAIDTAEADILKALEGDDA